MYFLKFGCNYEKKTVCFTGHRKIPSGEYKNIAERTQSEIIKLIKKGYRYFGAGGAMGYDTLAADIVLNLKSQFPQIRLILVLPCRDQSKSWSETDKNIYNQIREDADKIVYTSEKYDRGCMFKRNRHLVDHSSVCICYLISQTGGTAYTVEYSKKQGLQIINITDFA